MTTWFMAVMMIGGVGVTLRGYAFLSGKCWLRDRWDVYRLEKMSLDCALEQYKQSIPCDIVVSLTSIPSRLSKIEMTLKSLLLQSRVPREIRLYLPHYSIRENCEYDIPEKLSKLSPVLRIIRCEKDEGPATKFLPAIRDFEKINPTQQVLVVDDDMLYPSGLIEHFDHTSRVHPEVIIASSGWRVPEDFVDRPSTLMMNLGLRPPFPVKATRIKAPYRVDIVQGYSAYLIRPEFFSIAELSDRSQVPPETWTVDDVWISAHAKVKKKVFPFRRFCFSRQKDSKFYKNNSLSLLNRGLGENETRNNSIAIRYFSDRWMRSEHGKV